MRRDFPDAGAARRAAVELADSRQSAEWLMVAVLLLALGEVGGVWSALLLGRTDWRDLLVVGGLAEEDWPEVLDAELGSG